MIIPTNENFNYFNEILASFFHIRLIISAVFLLWPLDFEVAIFFLADFLVLFDITNEQNLGVDTCLVELNQLQDLFDMRLDLLSTCEFNLVLN